MGNSPTELIYIPDHSAIAIGTLPSQFLKERIQALVRALAAGIQKSEDMSFDVLTSTELDVASDDALDQWGALVVQERGALTESTYRLFIEAGIRANLSRSNTDDIIVVFEIVTRPSVEVRFFGMFPAGYILYVVRQSLLVDAHYSRVARIMESVRPIAVTGMHVEAQQGYFGFAGNPDAFGFGVGTFARLIQ